MSVSNVFGSSEVTDGELDGLNQAMSYVIGDFARRKEQQEYALDMTKWAWDKLGVIFHEKQDEVGRSIVENRATAVAAGHGTGKSFQAALAACWWVDTHPINQTYVATTAPTYDQITDIIFREVKNIHALSHERAARGLIRPEEALQGRVGEDNTWKIERAGKLYTVMKGRKPPDNKVSDAFQGIHARYVLAIGDEATGLGEDLIDSLDNITTGEHCRKLLISNPTNPFSYLGKIFLKPSYDDLGVPTWNKIHVSVFDLPTFHGRGGEACLPDSCPKYHEHQKHALGLGMPKIALESMSGPKFVRDKKAEYGEDSARYKARVLGQFAHEAGSTLISADDIYRAVDTIVEPFRDERPVLGVDVARFGDDWSVVYRVDRGVVMRRAWADGLDSGAELPREPALDDNGVNIIGYRLRMADAWHDAPLVTRTMPDGTTQMGTAERVHEIAMATGASAVRVDASGLGSGVVDRLWELSGGGKSYDVVEILGGAASPDRRGWYNFRAYHMDHSMRLGMFQGRIDIDPKDETLIDEMSGIIYEFADGQSGGGLKIASKESMKRKGKKSPDYVDAAWYALIPDDELADHLPGALVQTDFDEILSHSGRDAWFDRTW